MRLTPKKNNQTAMRQEDEEIIQVTLKPSDQKKSSVPSKSYSEARKSDAQQMYHQVVSNRKYLVEGRGFIILLIVLAVVLSQFVIGWFGTGIPHLQKMASELHSSQTATRQVGIWNLNMLWQTFLIMAVGASLSVAGTSFQSLFKNPLASPDVLGVTAGGSLGGGIFAILTSPYADGYGHWKYDTLHIGALSVEWMPIVMFVSGLLVVGVTVWIASRVDHGTHSTSTLILTGMVISSALTAGLGYLKAASVTVNDSDAVSLRLMPILQANINNLDHWSARLGLLLPLGILSPILIALSFHLDALSFGDEEARGMGIHTGLVRLTVIVCSTILTISVLSAFGPVSWIGMTVPFICRILVGPNNRKLFPLSILLGAVVVRGAYSIPIPWPAGVQVPVSLLLPIFCMPLFLVFLIWSRLRGGRVWN